MRYVPIALPIVFSLMCAGSVCHEFSEETTQ